MNKTMIHLGLALALSFGSKALADNEEMNQIPSDAKACVAEIVSIYAYVSCDGGAKFNVAANPGLDQIQFLSQLLGSFNGKGYDVVSCSNSLDGRFLCLFTHR